MSTHPVAERTVTLTVYAIEAQQRWPGDTVQVTLPERKADA